MIEQIHGGDVYRHKGVLDFSANVNPLGTPESVLNAAKESLHNVEHYPDVRKQELFTALAEYERVPQEWLICGNGAAELIFSFCWASKPEKALLAVPTFAEYEQALRACGCEIRYSYLQEKDGFLLKDSFLTELTPDLDVLFLCNPNNPTGLLIEPLLLEKIIATCRTYEIRLVLDECFVDFVENPDRVTCKGILKDNRHLFLLKAFTKRYAMAGLRLGYGICSDETLLDKMNHIVQPWNVSIPAQAAGTAALKEINYVNLARNLVRTEREYLIAELCKLKMTVYDSKANYIFFEGPAGLYDKLLEKKILIRNCGNYPGLREGYYRIAVRTREENEQLVEAMRAIIENV